MTPELAAENGQVISMVQAMLGLITPNIRLITLEMLSCEAVRVHFLIERENPRTREDVDDIFFEFDVLSGLKTDFDILVDARPRHEINLPGRWVYGRNEDDDDMYDE